LGIYGQPFGKPVKKPYLQHRTGVVFRHRPIDHQLNNCMKTLREMIDLIESAQSGRPELRTWGNRSTGETHYSVDGVEVGKDQYYQAWRADQKNQGNPDIKEEEVDEAYTPSGGELARDLIKMPDSDFNKKYGMSKQQANRYYSSNKLKEPGMDEAQKTDNRPASQFDREIVKAQPDGSCELKCGHKTSAKLSKNPVGKKIFCARCYELRNKEQAVDEDQATAQMGLMSAMGSNDNNPADQRRAMAQRAVEQLAAKR
jgi:hypothetical protein